MNKRRADGNMARESHWMKEPGKDRAMGVFIENFQELGEDGLCQHDEWMLSYQPGTQLDMASRMTAKLVAINNVLAGHAVHMCSRFLDANVRV